MLIIDKTWQEQLLHQRDVRILDEVSKETRSLLALKRERAKGIVSRNYKGIVKAAKCPYEVIWGTGGAQTKRAKKYDTDGTKYMWITNFN
jgi:hypothetical protein